MNLRNIAMLATGMVVIMGFAMLAPAFLQPHTAQSSFGHYDNNLPVILSFNVHYESAETSSWCNELSSILDKHQARAVVFVTGKIAESNPDCVSSFSSDIDIGSQTYSYANLTSIVDYQDALEEVHDGKKAVDRVGALDSRIFRAPYGSTDGNIYSMLNRSEIVADFSYVSHYNKYENDLFVKYPLSTYGLYEHDHNYSSELVQDLLRFRAPILIDFDNRVTIEKIDSFITGLKSEGGFGSKFIIANPSDLTAIDLTIRESN